MYILAQKYERAVSWNMFEEDDERKIRIVNRDWLEESVNAGCALTESCFTIVQFIDDDRSPKRELLGELLQLQCNGNAVLSLLFSTVVFIRRA